MRSAFGCCRTELPLQLPAPEQDVVVGGALEPDAASNAVPFAVGAGGGAAAAAACAPPQQAGAAPPARAEAVHRVLPWLYLATGYLDERAAEHLASCHRLHSLAVLDLARQRLAWPPPGVHWPVGAPGVGAAAAAAAALRGMAAHQGKARAAAMQSADGHAVLLSAAPEQGALAAEALALFFHLYCCMGLEEAAQAAGQAVPAGGPPPLPALRVQVRELAVAFRGWTQRVTLAWAYDAGHVDVVGDAAGSWDARVPLKFNATRREWRLQLWGLPPGRSYKYKYIVDGAWCVDTAAPTETDRWGNVNNIVAVPAPVPAAAPGAAGAADAAAAGAAWPTPAELVAACGPDEQLRMARLGAGLLALHARVPGPRRPPCPGPAPY
eukprot:scaffold20.g7796.t1